MTVEYRTGDLFAQHDLRALGHGANCFGVMGAGIAKEFKRRWPAMYQAYQRECQARRLRPGGLFTWTSPDGFTVYNLATQDRPGPNATFPAIASAVAAAVAHAEQHGIPAFGIPRIGAGIGGLDWLKVDETIRRVADASPVTVVVVSQPEGGARGSGTSRLVNEDDRLF